MKRRFPVLLARLLLFATVGMFSACSSFDAKWRAAEKSTGPHGATRWDGRWTSEKHAAPAGGGPAGGRLRAVLTPIVPNTSAQRIPAQRADFRANWLIFASGYTMTLTPVPRSRTDYRGTHDLPAIFGGTYRYTARLSGDRLAATYDSSYDRGTFDLTRVRP